MKKILIIGCGVIGLSSAIEILEKFEKNSVQVTIVSDQLYHKTTSYAAGMVFGVHCLGPDANKQRLKRMESTTFYRYLSENTHIEGVQFLPWITYCPVFQHEDTSQRIQQILDERPTNLIEHKVRVIETKDDEGGLFHFPPGAKCLLALSGIYPYVDPTKYMDTMFYRFQALGGQFKMLKAPLKSLKFDVIQHSLTQSFGDFSLVDFDTVINCTGMGAANLLQDRQMESSQGHFILAYAPHIRYGWCYPFTGAYVIPRTDGIVLIGGSHEVNTTTIPDKIILKRIWKYACMVDSSLEKQATIVSMGAGLRPFRNKTFRLEKERDATKQFNFPQNMTLIHNYGYGGSGWSLCWGSASEVVSMLSSSFSPSSSSSFSSFSSSSSSSSSALTDRFLSAFQGSSSTHQVLSPSMKQQQLTMRPSSSNSIASTSSSSGQKVFPIVDLKVLFTDRKWARTRDRLPKGYTLLEKTLNGRDEANLNSGSGGRNVFLAYRRQTSIVDRPITDIVVLAFHSGATHDNNIASTLYKKCPSVYYDPIVQTPSGNNADLNRNSGGKDIYLAVSRKPTHPPVTDIQVVIAPPNKKPRYVPDGYYLIEQNLNEGSGGNNVYLLVKRDQNNQ